MATYRFKCLRCEVTDTYRIKMKDAEPSMKLDCPKCDMNTFQHQIVEAAPIHFKGRGWPGKDMK